MLSFFLFSFWGEGPAVRQPLPLFGFTPDKITTLSKFYSMLIMLNYNLLKLSNVCMPNHVVPYFTTAFLFK